MGRLGEALAPSRLGTSFRWLVASSWTTNLGDGLALAAGPLLVASMTDDAFLVASAATLQWLPPLLFAPVAGVLTDRHDRRRIVMGVNGARVAVLVVLTVLVALDLASIGLVLAALFLLATAEVFVDSSTHTLLPMIVHRDDLAVANARLMAGFVNLNELAGPPIGAALFAVGYALPFGTQAVLVALGVVLVARTVLPAREADRPPPRRRVHREIAEGFRWASRHAAVRTLVLTIFVFNITYGAAWSVLVLYATQRLGLGEIGFGLLTTVTAAGGLLGIASYRRLTRRWSLGDLLRVGLVIETLTHLALAITTSPAVALSVFFVFGAHAFVWGTTSITVRQRAVPIDLQGRVGSVNTVGTFGGLVIGSAVGGLLAQQAGVTAPFWFAFVGSAVFVALIWRQLSHVAHEDQRPER